MPFSENRLYYGYWIVVAGFVTQFVAVGMANYVVGSFMIPMTEEFGWTRAEFTASRSIGQIVMACTGFVIGSYIDRFGGRPFIVSGSLLLAISIYSLGGIATLGQWLILNGLILTTGAAMIGNLVVNVTLGKWFVERRGRVVAVAGMGISLAGIVLPPVATWMVDEFGWRNSWQLLGIGAGLMTLPMAILMRRCPEDYALHPDGKTELELASGHGEAAKADFDRSMTRAQAMRTTSFYFLVLAFGLFQISITTMLIQTIPLMTDAGYSRLVASSMISIASVPAFLSKPFWGMLIDIYSPRKLAAIGAAVTGASVMLIVFSVARQMDVIVYAGFLMMGIGWGGLLPLQEVIWASFFGRRYLGSVRSTAMPFTFGMSALGPVLVAYYYDLAGDYNAALLVIAFCNIASAVMLFRHSSTTLASN
ncbi:MAG: MFS transporter [Gammaproteobacteria bacterium]|nr:MFS transporter [Gammaproteobacteria bacterium]MDP6731893.1 MFS transporter [Gammaproteobacteria bacterium]